MSLSRNTPEYATSICPVFGKPFAEGIKNLNAPDDRPEHKKLYEILSKHINKPITTVQNLTDIFDTVYLCERNGIKTPVWLTEPQAEMDNQPIYPNVLMPFLDEYFTNIQYLKTNENMLNLFSGPIINKLVTTFKEVIDNPKYPQKMWLHFTYDSTMYVLLKLLKMDYVICAEPGDGVVFELHEIDKKKIVKIIIFEPTGEKKIVELNTKQCPQPCTLDNFIESFKSLSPKEWDKLCHTEWVN